jgi:hypothetical protein
MLAQPQSVAQAFHRRDLANIHFEILRGSKRQRPAAVSQELCEFQPIAILLVDTEEADGRCE